MAKHGGIGVATRAQRFRCGETAIIAKADQVEGHENRVEIEASLSQSPAVAVSQMKIGQALSAHPERLRNMVFFGLHMINVSVNALNPGAVYRFDEFNGFLDGMQDTPFGGANPFHPASNARLLKNIRHPLKRFDRAFELGVVNSAGPGHYCLQVRFPVKTYHKYPNISRFVPRESG